jgi:hypothetical protein
MLVCSLCPSYQIFKITTLHVAFLYVDSRCRSQGSRGISVELVRDCSTSVGAWQLETMSVGAWGGMSAVQIAHRGSSRDAGCIVLANSKIEIQGTTHSKTGFNSQLSQFRGSPHMSLAHWAL